MGDLYEILCVSAVTAWELSRPLLWLLGRQTGIIVALILAIGFSIIGLTWPITNWPAAKFSPISLGIAAIALVDLLRPFGLQMPRWSLSELTVILGLYCVYIFASIGGVAFDPYAFGYSGGAGLGVPVALAGYAYYRKDWLMAAIVAGAQALWLAGIGSENLFDHLTSALLVPALFVAMVRRMRGIT